MLTSSAPQGGSKKPNLATSLERVLTATPWTSFDSAYSVRGKMEEQTRQQRFTVCEQRQPPLTDPDECLLFALTFATIRELIDEGIRYVELSISSVGGITPARARRLGYIDEITAGLRNPHSNPALYQRVVSSIDKKSFFVPLVRTLLMLHTSELAVDDDHPEFYRTYAREGQKADECRLAPLHEKTFFNQNSYRTILATIRQRDQVAGIDIAGQETSCFSKRGMGALKTLLKELISIASRWRETASRLGAAV